MTIDKRLITDNAPEFYGTVRINHDGCPAGEDTRRRLYLTRKADDKFGTVLAYCHNCGESGVAVEKDKMIFQQVAPALFGALEETELPDTMLTLDDPIVPTIARTWVHQYCIMPNEIEAFGLGYDPILHRVILPIHKMVNRELNVFGDGEAHFQLSGPGPVGYQARLLPHSKGPKYLNVQFKADEPFSTEIHNTSLDVSHGVCIVEDLMSAIKVSRHIATTVPLYGTHIKSERILELTKLGTVIVWLDNDNPQVVKHADRMVALVKAFGGKAIKITLLNDPKHHSNTEIEGTLREVLAC